MTKKLDEVQDKLSDYFLVKIVNPARKFSVIDYGCGCGAQLFALEIFGEYLARMFDRGMDRPAYIIYETMDQK